ncbi:MAG: sugar ABC transporter permease [Anaerolineae bacterium]|nr:sugar ABC transporter permease [Anaerolineae bacterium]
MTALQGIARPKTRVRQYRQSVSERRTAIFLIFPAVFLVAVLMYYPMLRSFFQSFFDTSMLRPEPRFIGFDNYTSLFGDSRFWDMVRNSLLWTFIVVAFQAIFGLMSAILLNQNLPGKGFMRALVLLPWVLPGVVNAILWRFMYDPQLGLVNSLLIGGKLTTVKTAWLAQGSTALLALIIAAIWKGFPFSTVMYLAALQSVDHEQLEAAQIDGANAWQRFFNVTLPAIAGIVRLNLLLTTIWTFNYFDLIWVTTKGGPNNATQIFPTIIYETGLTKFNFGLASAYGVIAVAVLLIFAVLYMRELLRSQAV